VLVARTPSRPVWLSISAAPIRGDDGQVHGAVSTLADVTALHDLEEQREDYIRAISHDLRNPLTVVTGMTEWLHRRLGQQGMEREASVAEKALRSATRMAAMVADLLYSIRLEAGQTLLDPRPTDLGRLAADAMEHLSTPEDRARLRLVVPAGLPPANADPDRVERALVNLISNALKYSPPDQTVEIRLDAQDERLVVAVLDRGPGITEAELPHLFQRFYRAKTGERVEGTGLGLYITRLIAEAHGGQAWAESQLGQGSTFYISLPVAK
jgi:signal transduction histidine kinase